LISNNVLCPLAALLQQFEFHCESECGTKLCYSIEANSLSWFGHVQRRPDSRIVKKIFIWTPETVRLKGRPKQRWEDNIIQDIGQLNINHWTACVPDRVKWKNVVEKAKTFNIRNLSA
jgi:hypothetical protein